jgi:hypothetical protein
MTDLTPILNERLKSQNSQPTLDPSLALQKIDEFLKEAYRIVSPRSPENSRGLLKSFKECAYSFPQLIFKRYKASLPFDSSATQTDRHLLER